MRANRQILDRLHDIWAHPKLYDVVLPVALGDWPTFAKTVITHLEYANAAMPTPKWLENVKKDIAKNTPGVLAEGRTEFVSSSLTEPKMSGKFRKYRCEATTRAGGIVNLSLSPTLLGHVLEAVETDAAYFAITRQGSGIDTNYIVEAVEE